MKIPDSGDIDSVDAALDALIEKLNGLKLTVTWEKWPGEPNLWCLFWQKETTLYNKSHLAYG